MFCTYSHLSFLSTYLQTCKYVVTPIIGGNQKYLSPRGIPILPPDGGVRTLIRSDVTTRP